MANLILKLNKNFLAMGCFKNSQVKSIMYIVF